MSYLAPIVAFKVSESSISSCTNKDLYLTTFVINSLEDGSGLIAPDSLFSFLYSNPEVIKFESPRAYLIFDSRVSIVTFALNFVFVGPEKFIGSPRADGIKG